MVIVDRRICLLLLLVITVSKATRICLWEKKKIQKVVTKILTQYTTVMRIPVRDKEDATGSSHFIEGFCLGCLGVSCGHHCVPDCHWCPYYYDDTDKGKTYCNGGCKCKWYDDDSDGEWYHHKINNSTSPTVIIRE